MKISRERLAQLVKEELSISLGGVGDVGGDMGHEEEHSEPEGEGSMAKQNLWRMTEYAKELYNLIDDDEDLEPWVQEKIAVASFMMDSVGHYLEYSKHKEQANTVMASDQMNDEPDHEIEVELEPEMSDEEEYELDLEPEEYEDEEGDEDEDEREEL